MGTGCGQDGGSFRIGGGRLLQSLLQMGCGFTRVLRERKAVSQIIGLL